jgi:hypothetical protein
MIALKVSVGMAAGLPLRFLSAARPYKLGLHRQAIARHSRMTWRRTALPPVRLVILAAFPHSIFNKDRSGPLARETRGSA